MVGLRARRLRRRADRARARRRRLCVESLKLVQPTLDDVFVEKTGRHLEGAEDEAPAEEAGAGDRPGVSAAP